MAQRTRAVLVRQFGATLERLRGDRSRQQIVNRASALGVTLDPSALFQYERGTVAAPDPAALWALAKIYGISLEALIDLLVANRKDPKYEGDDPPPVPDSAIVVSSPEERAMFAMLQDMDASLRREVVDYAVFVSVRELPDDERAAVMDHLRASVQLARHGAAAQSVDRTALATQGLRRRGSSRSGAGGRATRGGQR